MNEVAVRGINPDNAILYPTTTVNVQGQGNKDSMVTITTSVNVFKEQVTKRTVIVKKNFTNDYDWYIL